MNVRHIYLWCVVSTLLALVHSQANPEGFAWVGG